MAVAWPPDCPTVSRKKRETRLHARTALSLPPSLSYRALYHTRLLSRPSFSSWDGPNLLQFLGSYFCSFVFRITWNWGRDLGGWSGEFCVCKRIASIYTGGKLVHIITEPAISPSMLEYKHEYVLHDSWALIWSLFWAHILKGFPVFILQCGRDRPKTVSFPFLFEGEIISN